MSDPTGPVIELPPLHYQDAVRELAQAHASGINLTAYVVPDPDERVVRLVEVSDDFPEAGVQRPTSPDRLEWIVPVFPMTASRDFPFRSEIAQVTKGEWESLQSGELRLNRDWDLARVQEVQLGE